MSNPELYFNNNVVNGMNLIRTMLAFNCKRFIFSSTAAIFGEPIYTPIDEEHPKNPINAYGESKLMFETILEWYHRAYDLRFNSFRYFNAAGASTNLGEQHKHESHLIPIVINSIIDKSENRMVNIFGNDYPTKDGTCVRDYIHVLDIAQAHILALENLKTNPCHKYNLGNGNGFTILEVLEAIEKISGDKVIFKFQERRPGDPAVLIASSTYAQRELGWQPQYKELVDIIETAWNWHYANPFGYKK